MNMIKLIKKVPTVLNIVKKQTSIVILELRLKDK